MFLTTRMLDIRLSILTALFPERFLVTSAGFRSS